MPNAHASRWVLTLFSGFVETKTSNLCQVTKQRSLIALFLSHSWTHGKLCFWALLAVDQGHVTSSGSQVEMSGNTCHFTVSVSFFHTSLYIEMKTAKGISRRKSWASSGRKSAMKVTWSPAEFFKAEQLQVIKPLIFPHHLLLRYEAAYSDFSMELPEW